MALTQDIADLKDALLNLVFPPECVLCRTPMTDAAEPVICLECIEELREPPDPICNQCGRPTQGLGSDPPALCGLCLRSPPHFTKARFGYLYEGKLREAILRFKFQRAVRVGKTLSALMHALLQAHFRVSDFDVIVPIPLDLVTLRKRGFNQAHILANGISGATGVPVDFRSLTKVKSTVPQVGLPREQRLKNLRAAFGVLDPSNIRGRRVLLVDDVSTTGATLNEASRTLKRAGTQKIECLVLSIRAPSFDSA